MLSISSEGVFLGVEKEGAKCIRFVFGYRVTDEEMALVVCASEAEILREHLGTLIEEQWANGKS